MARLVTSILLTVLVQLLASACAGSAVSPQQKMPLMPPSSNVIELNLWTFRGSVADGRLWLVEFYVPWCRGCKRMAEQYDELGQVFRFHPDIAVARFDCMQDEDMCERLGVDRTPTLKLFLRGKAVETYKADFYHVDLMGPFLTKMLDKYGAELAEREGGAVAEATAAAENNGVGAGDDRQQSSAGIPTTPVEPRVYDRPGETTLMPSAADVDIAAGSGDVLRTEGPSEPVEPSVRSISPREAVGVDGGDVEGVVTAMAERGAGGGNGRGVDGFGGEPLQRRGRYGGLAAETLRREKEEL